jgi:hypothetical protein
MIKARTVGNWFREIVGIKEDYSEQYRYESMSRNYLVGHVEEWTGEKPSYIWSELDLGTFENNDERMTCDLIFQYEKMIWIIEVKDRTSLKRVFENEEYTSAVSQLREYKRRILELGWWPDLTINLGVFWAFNPSEIEDKMLPIDREFSLLWPKDRR